MPKKSLLTWVPAGKRWMKKLGGKMYAVSCRQLNCAETRDASIAAANAWWEKKLTEIATVPPTEEEVRANAFKVWMMVQDWQQLDEASREKLVDSMVGPGQYRKIKGQADTMVAATETPAPADRTVGAQVKAWQDFLRNICKSGQMSEGRFDSYCRAVGIFRDWIGEATPVDAIDEAKLEAYFSHLSFQVGGNKYSPAYAHTLLMTAKQFISRLAEKKLIPLPGNIRSRRLRLNQSAPKAIETRSSPSRSIGCAGRFWREGRPGGRVRLLRPAAKGRASLSPPATGPAGVQSDPGPDREGLPAFRHRNSWLLLIGGVPARCHRSLKSARVHCRDGGGSSRQSRPAPGAGFARRKVTHAARNPATAPITGVPPVFQSAVGRQPASRLARRAAAASGRDARPYTNASGWSAKHSNRGERAMTKWNCRGFLKSCARKILSKDLKIRKIMRFGQSLAGQ